ncbi:Alpha/Beta hydrolase protein [Mycena polygramma]|nr:Alpha/Beta hydrolase protein [Mycena polygramma]
MSAAPQSKYGQLSWSQSLGMVAKMLPLPVAISWSVVTTAHASHNRERTLKRIVGDTVLRYTIAHLSVPQLQSALGTTLGMYQQWTKKNKLPAIVDELGEDARLLWIGPKRLDRVVLFLHGGGFVLPAAGFTVSFWRYVQLELEKKNIDVGLALFSYSLSPFVSFPAPLKQAALALDFLSAAGVKPQNLQLVGDSAGGNLILQVLSQMLHPRGGVPEIRLPAPLRGVLLISPCVNLSADSKSHDENDGRDFLTKRAVCAWSAQILAGVPEADRAFVEAVRAPEGWFHGVDGLAEHVLITAGGAELLRDDIVVFGEAFKKQHLNTKLVVQKNGLHEDMFLDFVLNEKKLSTLTPLIVEWLATGFTAQPNM